MSVCRIKICGITRGEDAELAVELGAWALGFVFYSRSSRYLSPAIAKSIGSHLPERVRRVGVFVDSGIDEITQVVAQSGIDTVQLHGHETVEYCDQLKKQLPKIQLIKAFGIQNADDLKKVSHYEFCNAILLDSFSLGTVPGGNGTRFDWTLSNLISPDLRSKLILAGGLKAENIADATERFSPYALDVSSGVEKQPGIKDEKLLKEFFSAAKGNKYDFAK